MVGGGGMLVDARFAVEAARRVSSNGTFNQADASRVLVDEMGQVVDKTINDDEALAKLAAFLELVHGDLRELTDWAGIHDLALELIKLLLFHQQLSFGDLVGRELTQVVSETEHRQAANKPFGRIVVEPANTVAVVVGVLVMEVVVTLSEGEESGDDVIAWGALVVVGVLAEVVGNRVDAEGGVVDKADGCRHPFIQLARCLSCDR